MNKELFVAWSKNGFGLSLGGGDVMASTSHSRIEEGCEEGEKVVRYIPEPKWRKFDPGLPPEHSVYLCLTDDDVPVVLFYSHSLKIWLDEQQRPRRMYSYLDVPIPVVKRPTGRESG